MNNIGWTTSLGSISGIKVITSVHCYITKTVVRGIADSRRPNNKKPLYRKVVIRIPTAYLVNGALVCHPDWHDKMLMKMGKRMIGDIEDMARKAFTK